MQPTAAPGPPYRADLSMGYELHLLTTPGFTTLPRQEQSLALYLARTAGARAAAAAPRELRHAPEASAYYHAVVSLAAGQGVLTAEEDRRWRRRCATPESADLRVRVFLLGWRERARTLSATPRAPEHGGAQRGAA